MQAAKLDRRTIAGLILISASMLAYEISLTRLFAVQQFYHFVFVVVSLAVLAIAASGTLLALKPTRAPLALLAFVYAISMVASYLTINFLPFDSYSIAWDPKQIGILLLYFLAAGTPFLFAGWVIGACLSAAGDEAHLPYAANLGGSALGCVLALIVLMAFGGEGALAFSACLGFLAASIFPSKPMVRIPCLLLTALGLVCVVRFPSGLTMRLSPYKPLAVSQLLPDAETTITHWSASSRLDAIESRSIHVFPGLSLNAVVTLPQQTALFIDGEGPFPISNLDPQDETASLLASYMPSGLAYILRPESHALILQPGAGLEAILALASGAKHVTVSDPEPLITETLAGFYAGFSHDLIKEPRLEVVPRSDRGTLHVASGSYDVIVFALSDPYRPVTSGAFSLGEDFTLTVEAFQNAYALAGNDGLLVITRWLGTPPSESARAWATLLAAMEIQGVVDPGKNLIAYRGMRTATMIASHRPFTSDELQATRRFLISNAFDPIHLPDLDPSELNRFNRLPSDTYYELFQSILIDRSATISAYNFNLEPPRDDQPFFFHYFRWRQTPEILATLGLTWQPFGGSGYFVLLALLALMLLLALPLIVAPWLVIRRRRSSQRATRTSIGYFAFLGAGYLLVEIPLISRLTLLLDRPALSLAVVLFTLLLASGVGSLLSPRLPLRKMLLALVAAVLLSTLLLPLATKTSFSWNLWLRLLLAAVFLSPMGLLMGIPFAAGLQRLERHMPGMIPWAWSINGAISGISGVMAVMVALDWGHSATLLLGAAAYLGAWATVPRIDK
ncbi:MAG TPA: hypothetical protein G4O08_10270 [Anaerolineae bacterium]|nr:hypothetical protein [Anaerolineae bacterium]